MFFFNYSENPVWSTLGHHSIQSSISHRLPQSWPTNLYIFGIRRSRSVDWCGPIGGKVMQLGAPSTDVERSPPIFYPHHWNIYRNTSIQSLKLTGIRGDRRRVAALQARDQLFPPVWQARSTDLVLLIPKIYRFVGQLWGNRCEIIDWMEWCPNGTLAL